MGKKKAVPPVTESRKSRVSGFIKCLVGQFMDDNIPMIASGMVYSTLVALVPCITFVYAILDGFGAIKPFFNLISTFFVETFGPNAGETLMSYLEGFTQNAAGLGVVGLLSFFITFMLLIDKVYGIVNRIFKTPINPNPAKRFTGYLTFLAVGVVLIACYISVQGMFSNWVAALTGRPEISGFDKVIKVCAPVLILWVSVFLIIFLIPTCRVEFKSAFWGSIFGTAGLFALSTIFKFLVRSMVKYSVIYGSLGAVFFFLMFIYYLWVIVITSVAFSYVHQFKPVYGKAGGSPFTPARQLSEGVNIMMLIGQNYREGRGVTTLSELESKLLIPGNRLQKQLEQLEEINFIVKADSAKGHSFLPARPLDSLDMEELAGSIFGYGQLTSEEMDTIGEAVAAQVKDDGVESLKKLTVENLLERV